MKLICNRGFPPRALQKLVRETSDEQVRDLLAVTTGTCFLAADDERVLFIGGVCTPSLLSNAKIFWCFKTGSLTKRELRRGLDVAKQYLDTQGGEAFCEISPDDATGARFAKFFGFEFLTQSGDRNLYHRKT